MKANIKKYIFLVNDITNVILKKERVKDQEIAGRLRNALIIVSIILLIAIFLNIYLFIN